MSAGSEKPVDELRQQLRALGYLDAGVDRFVLGGARETRGPIATAARAGIRVGVLGGILLGPAAAIGLGARLPGLINGVRDAVVMAAYLSVFFCLALAVLSCLVSLGTAAIAGPRDERFASRARTLSAAAGGVIAIGCIAYLTFWWRNANAGFGWSAPVSTTLALAVAIAIALLLGHAVRIATLGVLGAAGGATAALPRVPSGSWRIVIGGGLLAFAGAAALLVVTAPSVDASSRTGGPRLAVVSSGLRVRVVAIDGFDRDTYLHLRASLPHLSQTLGWRCADLSSQDTTDPARAWTTIATGVPPERHGVRAIETRRVAGTGGVLRGGSAVMGLLATATDAVRLTRPSVASREDRQAKTVWEVAADAGLRTAVVNWWATWPAPPADGIVLTDRALLRLERGGTLDGEIAPAAMYDVLRGAWPEIRRRARTAAAEAFGTGGDPQVVDILRRSAELDATIVGMVQALPSGTLDLSVAYLPGLDIAQTALLGGSAGTLAPSAAAARVDALRSYYPFLDRIAAPLLEPAEGVTVMVMTQPGRVQSTGGGLFAIGPDYASTRLSGQAVFPEDVNIRRHAAPVDIAPTILNALGIPLSRELAGTPAEGMVAVARATPERYVESYGRPFVSPAARQGTPLDQEMIDRLRSLGYVK